MKVRDAMTGTVDTISPATTVLEAARRMRDDDIGAIPVAENDRLVGMVTDRDLVVRSLADAHDVATTSVSDAMSSGVLYCFDDQSGKEVLEMMEKQQVRRMPVVDHDKNLVGIVTLGDLAVEGDEEKAGDALEGISQPVH